MQNRFTEFVVGLFMVAGFAAIVYLALNLGEVPFLTRTSTYTIEAEFENVSGVKKGAPVQVAGVVVGEVEAIKLNEDRYAQITLRVDKDLKIPLDSIVSVKSQGIIGDKYIQISLGGDPENFAPDEIIVDTESAVDIESLISKFAFGSAK
ncbi:MAG: outer membrane lipid asymmetry maintenance protein MlaD [Desulfocapsaceae bacterium]|jgi:phospholipid/cholesterol/gamma-HCH transport system substrate-binding protein